jgi:hypothetical protein
MFNGENLQRSFQDGLWMEIEVDKNHLLAKIADNFDWDNVLSGLKKFYCHNNGRPTVSTRVKVGILIVKHLYKWSDTFAVQQLKENLYLQYLCDISPILANKKNVLDDSTMTYFRKQIGEEGIQIIEQEVERLLAKNGKTRGNTLIVDSTIVPDNIEYPTDVHLLEKARRKLVKFVDEFCEKLNQQKPRTYRKVARKAFLNFIKFRKKGTKLRIKTQKKLIRFVNRNLNQVKELAQKIQEIPQKVQKEIEVITQILEQQKQVAKKQQVKHRIVSIHRPQVRPMVKGKFPNKVEFGPKVNLVKKGKGLFLQEIDNENLSDTELMGKTEKFWEEKFGKPPTAAVGDRGYFSAKNVKELEEAGVNKIAIAPKGKSKPNYTKASCYKKLCRDRNAIEADISLLKRKYGFDRNRYKDENIWIRMGLIARNLKVAMS